MIDCNLAHDNILYCCGKTTENRESLQSDLKIMLDWFGKSRMMVNAGKLLYMFFGKHKPLKIEIEGLKQKSAKSVKLVGLIIDFNLTFDTHISNFCKTASAKMKSLSRIRNALDEK